MTAHLTEKRMRTPCYTTKTGIRIGSAYTYPLRQLNADEERMQAALLGLGRRSIPLKYMALLCTAAVLALMWAFKP